MEVSVAAAAGQAVGAGGRAKRGGRRQRDGLVQDIAHLDVAVHDVPLVQVRGDAQQLHEERFYLRLFKETASEARVGIVIVRATPMEI